MTTAYSTNDDDLLLAVRYVLNECEPAELVAFEARLGDDPAVQSALVEAVQIVGMLQATPTCPEFAPQKLRPVTTRRSWQIASLVAATLLVAVVAVWQAMPAPQTDITAQIDNASPESNTVLVQAWTALDPQLAPLSDEEDEAPSEDEIASDVPDWLLAAVMAEAEQGQSDDNEEREEETQL